MKGRLEIFFLLLFRRIGTAFKEGEASKDEFERFRGFFYAREEVEITIGSI